MSSQQRIQCLRFRNLIKSKETFIIPFANHPKQDEIALVCVHIYILRSSESDVKQLLLYVLLILYLTRQYSSVLCSYNLNGNKMNPLDTRLFWAIAGATVYLAICKLV